MRSDVDAGEQQAAYVFPTLMAVCFGGTWVAGKVAVDAISPFTLAATRFAIASVLLWGWARSKPVTVIGKTATARFSSVKATLYGTVTGTLLLLPFAIGERGWTKLAAAPVLAWAGPLYLAVFGTVLPFVLLYEGVRRIGAGRATSFAFLIPIFGVVSSVLILGEHLSRLTVIGGALVLAGLWLVQRRPGERPTPATQTSA